MGEANVYLQQRPRQALTRSPLAWEEHRSAPTCVPAELCVWPKRRGRQFRQALGHHGGAIQGIRREARHPDDLLLHEAWGRDSDRQHLEQVSAAKQKALLQDEEPYHRRCQCPACRGGGGSGLAGTMTRCQGRWPIEGRIGVVPRDISSRPPQREAVLELPMDRMQHPAINQRWYTKSWLTQC